MAERIETPPGAPDALELELFASAASGERMALVALAVLARDPATYDPPIPEVEAAASAEAFARLAVMQGHPDDKLLLADILCQRSAAATNRAHASRLLTEATYWMREAMGQGHPQAAMRLAWLLSFLGDDGNEAAAIELNRLMDALGPKQAAAVMEQVGSLASEQAK